jgi:hypothetical protein
MEAVIRKLILGKCRRLEKRSLLVKCNGIIRKLTGERQKTGKMKLTWEKNAG